MTERTIFLAALDIDDPAERAAYVERACGDDTGLRGQVEDLLNAHRQPRGFMARPAPALFATTDQPPAAEGPGTVIGPYKLLEQIGEGGFGVVFLAEQTRPVRRKVALKILKPGMDTKQVVARFEAERQALAIMDHPNIARVFDGGATPSGRPYFVMELVKGVPITDFCDRNQLTPRHRLELFVQVCSSVQHAHQKGIIHRDLKPSNVLVTVHDTTPVVKVIDFGVAKALGQELTERTLFTGFAQMIGTPLYMSPEQAGQSGLDVDTRGDIYSLGVLLYELLTGTTPFTAERFKKAGYDEIRRIIREEEPPKPSTRLSESKDSLPSVAAQRQTEPAKLTRLVRGELDWIVMKALEKDRNRRYETANGFAADVQRYLADEPVQACPPSATYRLRKFARRNRTRLVAAVVLGSALLVAVSGIGWAVRDREARSKEQVRERTERLTRTEQAVDQALGQAARHRAGLHVELRDKGTRELLNQPARWLAQIRAGRSELDRARSLADGAEAPLDAGLTGRMQSLAQELADDEADYRLALRLEKIREDRSTWVAGNFDYSLAAEQYPRAFQDAGLPVAPGQEEELAARLARSPIRDQLLGALDDWALVAWFTGQRDLHRRLLQVARRADPDPGWKDQIRDPSRWRDRDALKALAARGLVDPAVMARLSPQMLHLLGDLLPEGEAENWLRQAQALHPTDFWLNFELGLALMKSQPARAEGFYRAALAVRPTSTAAWTNLGVTLFNQKEYDRAVEAYTRAIALDPGHEIAWDNRHRVFTIVLKQHERAVREYSEAIRLKSDNPLGWYYRGQVQTDLNLAVADYTKALELKPDHVDARFRRGMIHWTRGEGVLAITDFSKVIELKPDHRGALLRRGLHYQNLRQWDKAIADFTRHLELGPDPQDTVWGVARFAVRHDHLAWLLLTCPDPKFRDPVRALRLAKKAIELDEPEGQNWQTLAWAQYRAGDWKTAIVSLEKAREVGGTEDGHDWFLRAMAHWRLGNKNEARGWYDKAVAWMGKNKPNDEVLREFRAEASALLGVAGGAAEIAPLPHVKK